MEAQPVGRGARGRDGAPGILGGAPGPGPGASVLSHGRGRELQLEVLVLEDAAEGGAALGAAEGPVALAAATLGELCEESQPGTPSIETAKLIKCLHLLWIQNRF